MSKKGIRALVYVSLVSVVIWGATGYLVIAPQMTTETRET
jgi:hypothetical protein